MLKEKQYVYPVYCDVWNELLSEIFIGTGGQCACAHVFRHLAGYFSHGCIFAFISNSTLLPATLILTLDGFLQDAYAM